MKIDVKDSVTKLKAASISLLGKGLLAKGLLSKVLPVGLEIELIVAVDIGYQDIKFVQFKRQHRGGDWSLLSCEIITLPPGVSEEENKEKKDKERIKALKDFFTNKNLKKTKVVCVVNDIKGIEKKILTPLMKTLELKQAIYWKMKDFIHFPLEEACIDFKIIGKVDVDGETKDEIFTVAFSRDTINQYLHFFKGAKVQPSSFVSLATCIEHNFLALSLDKNETLAFVDLGATHTQLTIFRNSKFVFARQLPVTGISITRAMTTVLQIPGGRISLSFNEAEKIKREYGIPSPGSEPIAGKNITQNQVLSLIRPEIEKLTREIAQSFDYYREEFGGPKINKLMLIGRGANLKGIDAILSQGLGIPVELANPFSETPGSNYRTKEERNRAVTFFACIGAAKTMIKQIKSRIEEINLLPVEIKEQNRLFVRRVTFEVVITAFVLTGFLVLFGMKFAVSGMQKRLTSIEAQLYSHRYKQEEASVKGIVSQIYAREPRWNDVFREISNVVPNNIYLERLSYSNDELILEGVIISKIDSTEGVLSDFMLSLEKGIFKNVSLIESKRLKDKKKFGRSEFKLKCRIE